jgi:hypothetical protein
MIQQFTFDGNGRQIDARGVTFRYESGTDASGITDLKLWIDGNAVGTLSPGDLLELPMEGKRWEVKPVSPTCYGVVKVGIGKITTTKVAGVVSTVDGGKARSISGGAFAGVMGVGGAAGVSSLAQVWNKSTNANIIINSLSASSSGVLDFGAWLNSSALVSVIGSGSAKRQGKPASTVAELRGGTLLNSSFPAGSTWLKQWAHANDWRMTEPIVIPPGAGLCVHNWTLNATIQLSIEWFEEAI